jgi:hypothetical protein
VHSGVGSTTRTRLHGSHYDRPGKQGSIFRILPDGKLGNYPDSRDVEDPGLIAAWPLQGKSTVLSEDDVKGKLQDWLEAAGWHVHVIWGHGRGIDIEARRGSHRWVIEVKGSGSREPMRVNYFLAILGELLQRMAGPDASYSIALPDMPQFRGLWQRLPSIAKHRTGITALFVALSGKISEERD